jgi:hypothetical protein
MDKPDRNWSAEVGRSSNAPGRRGSLDHPRRIARSLEHSAEASSRRKADPFRSAMSMLVFYINRL